MRLIDADALLDYIGIAHDSACSKCKHSNDCRKYNMYTRNDICQMVDDMPTVGSWISVNERLPEVGRVVLAFGTRSATTGMFQGVNKRNDLWWWKGHTIKHVSHWMPLPESPKEADE